MKRVLLFFSLALSLCCVSCPTVDPASAYLTISLFPEKSSLLHGEQVLISSEIKTPKDTVPIYFWYINGVYQAAQTASYLIFSATPDETTNYEISVTVLQAKLTAKASCNILVETAQTPKAKFLEQNRIFDEDENFSFTIEAEDENGYELFATWFLDDKQIPLPPNQFRLSKNQIPIEFFSQFKNEYTLKAVISNRYKRTELVTQFIVANDFFFIFSEKNYSTIYGQPINISILTNRPERATFEWYFDDVDITAKTHENNLNWICPAISSNLNETKVSTLKVKATYFDNDNIEQILESSTFIIIQKQNRPSVQLFYERTLLNDGAVIDLNFFDIQTKQKLLFTSSVVDVDNDPIFLSWKFNGVEKGTQNEFELDLSTLNEVEQTYPLSLTASDRLTPDVVLNFSIRIKRGPNIFAKQYNCSGETLEIEIDKNENFNEVALLITNPNREKRPTTNPKSLKSKGALFDTATIIPSGDQKSQKFYNCKYNYDQNLNTPTPILETLEEIDATMLASNKALPFNKSKSAERKTVEVWVANDCITGVSKKAATVSTELAKTLADLFLNPVESNQANDIYDYVTAFAGDPWGDKFYPPFLGRSDKIILLLYDIDNDGNEEIVEGKSYSGGFFHAKDNYLPTSVAYSNGTLMIYLDAVLFGTTPTGDLSWSIKDYWPSFIVSTLVHEFQHLINFYQKIYHSNNALLREETWLNEACSMMCEELLAEKLKIDGPRGINYDDFSDGINENKLGRTPKFLCSYFSNSLIATNSETFSIENYSASYLFGAWLLRNFGGANLLKNLIQSGKTGLDNVTSAIYTTTKKEFSETELLNCFLSACWFSDVKNLSAPFSFNSDNKFSSTIVASSPILYRLGSLNINKFSTINPLTNQVQNGLLHFDLNSLESTAIDLPYFSGYFVKIPKSSIEVNKTVLLDLPAGYNVTVLKK